MERRGLVLSCRKAKSSDRGDGTGKGCQEISPWWVRFFSEINVMFSMLILFYSCYSLNIPSNNSKIRNQDTWLCWFSVIPLTEKKMNIGSTQYVWHEFQKRRGCRSPCKGGYQEGGMILLFKLCWCGIWSLQSDETNCFLLIHSLRFNLEKNSF